MPDIDFGRISESLNEKMDRDVGNPSITGKERIVVFGIPDYSAGITTTTNSYTAPKAGFVQVNGSMGAWATSELKVNGVLVDRFRNVYSDSGASYGMQCIVDKGDVVTQSGGSGTATMRFYPFKGVN